MARSLRRVAAAAQDGGLKGGWMLRSPLMLGAAAASVMFIVGALTALAAAQIPVSLFE